MTRDGKVIALLLGAILLVLLAAVLMTVVLPPIAANRQATLDAIMHAVNSGGGQP